MSVSQEISTHFMNCVIVDKPHEVPLSIMPSILFTELVYAEYTVQCMSSK